MSARCVVVSAIPACGSNCDRAYEEDKHMNNEPLSILIIEDNAQLAANLYDYLAACGHNLDAAPDGLSGLHLASSKDYDAILLDWNLPRLDGLTVLRRLRKDAKKKVPIIMLLSLIHI